MKTKENKKLRIRFRKINLYLFAVVILLLGSILVWKFCKNANNHHVMIEVNIDDFDEIIHERLGNIFVKHNG